MKKVLGSYPDMISKIFEYANRGTLGGILMALGVIQGDLAAADKALATDLTSVDKGSIFFCCANSYPNIFSKAITFKWPYNNTFLQQCFK